MVRILLVRVGGMCRCRRFLVWSLRGRLAFGMRVRRSISVTICAELAQSLKPQRAAPPGAARLWSFALVMLLLWAGYGQAPRRLVRGSRAMVSSGRLGRVLDRALGGCARGEVTKVHCQIHADDVISARTASSAVTMIG